MTESGIATISKKREQHGAREGALLRRYVDILEKQNAAIDVRDLDGIDRTIRLERQILDDLEALARVNLPGLSSGSDHGEKSELFSYARALQLRNRELLAQRSAEIARRIGEVRIPHQRKRVYSHRDAGGGMVDLTL